MIEIRVGEQQWVTEGSLRLQRRDPTQSPHRFTLSSFGTMQRITQTDAVACRGCSGYQKFVRESWVFSLRWFRIYLSYIFPVKISFAEQLIKPSFAAPVFQRWVFLGTIVQK